jgi:hypothetical protein
VHEFATVLAVGHVADDVERLPGLRERALERVVVVGRHDERARRPTSRRFEPARQRREEPVQRPDRVVGVEHLVQLVVQRSGARHHVRVLGDPAEVVQIDVGILEAGGQVASELGTARQVAATLPPSTRRPATEVRARSEQRDNPTFQHRAHHPAAVRGERVLHGDPLPTT